MGELINSFILGTASPVVDDGVYFTDTSPTAIATSTYSMTFYAPAFAFDTSTSHTGTYNYASWLSASPYASAQQRLSYDMGTSKLVNKMRISNFHLSGTGERERGIRDIRVYGSTNASDYNTTYGSDTALTLLYDGATKKHSSFNGSDYDNFIMAAGTYRYIIIDISTNHYYTGDPSVGVRRIEFGYQSDLTVPSGNPNLWTAFSSPTAQATSEFGAALVAENAADTDLSLTGGWTNNAWLSGSGQTSNQRWSWDRGSEIFLNKLRVSNMISNGGSSSNGIKTVVIYGSNNASDYNNTYAANTALTTLYSGDIPEHVAQDTADWFYPTLLDYDEYRYIVMDCADMYAGTTYMGFRRMMTG